MNKSELIARYRHYGEDLVAIDNVEFFKEMKNNITDPSNSKVDCDSDVVTFSIDGYDYYCYSSCYKVGWQGDVDCDAYYFKIKVSTEADREAMRAMFSRENDYTVLDDLDDVEEDEWVDVHVSSMNIV